MDKRRCPPETIAPMKDVFERLLVETDNIGKINNRQLGEKLYNINKISDYCLVSLGDIYPSIKTSAWFISDEMPKAIARLKAGVPGTNLIQKCVPHIKNMVRFFNEEYDPNDLYESELEPQSESEPQSEYESEYESESEPEDEPNNSGTLFPSHKYLNLSDKSEFPQVKSQYRKLSLTYHPDKCPNDKTPGMDKSQCETEFKILNNEYDTIKEKLNIVGGRKRKTRRSSRKSYKNKSNTKKSMSKKNKRKNTRKTSRKNSRK